MVLKVSILKMSQVRNSYKDRVVVAWGERLYVCGVVRPIIHTLKTFLKQY